MMSPSLASILLQRPNYSIEQEKGRAGVQQSEQALCETIKRVVQEALRSLHHPCERSPRCSLEVILQSELDDAMAMFSDDLAKVVDGLLVEAEPARRITDVVSRAARRTVGNAIAMNITDDIQRRVDVVVSLRIALRVARERLVEDVEEPGAELDLLALTDVEVLEERHIVIPTMRRPQIERRNVGADI